MPASRHSQAATCFLLVIEDGKPVVYTYELGGATPYGKFRDNMM